LRVLALELVTVLPRLLLWLRLRLRLRLLLVWALPRLPRLLLR